MEYKIEIKESFGEKRIVGWVDDTDVIVIGLHTNKPDTVMMSSCLPSDIDKAERYVYCMKAAFAKHRALKYNR